MTNYIKLLKAIFANASGNLAKAKTILQEIDHYFSYYLLAKVHKEYDEKNKAREYIKAAYEKKKYKLIIAGVVEIFDTPDIEELIGATNNQKVKILPDASSRF